MRRFVAALLSVLIVGSGLIDGPGRSVILAQDAPPDVGAAVVENALSGPGLFGPFSCPSGRASTRFDQGGFVAVATGGCNDAAQAAFVGSGVQGLTFIDGEARVEGRTLSGGDRAVMQMAIRTQPGPSFGNIAATLNPIRGTIDLTVFANGQSKVLAQRADLKDLLAADDFNSVTVRAQESTFWVLVNDKPMISASDSTWGSGGVSVSVGRAGPASAQDTLEVSAIFKNIRVSGLAAGDVARATTYRDPREIFTATSFPCTLPTALPAEINLTAPGPDVDPRVAALTGAWEGQWGEGGANPLPSRLYVESIDGSRASVVYTWGNAPGTTPGWNRMSLEIDAEGKIAWGPTNRRFAFWLDGDAVAGTLDTPQFTSKVSMHRCPPV